MTEQKTIIWQSWLQGVNTSMPFVNYLAMREWELKATESKKFELIVISEANIGDYVPEYFDILSRTPFDRSAPHKADLLRILLLEKYGGLWADASLFPTKSINQIFSSITNSSGFFAFAWDSISVNEAKGNRCFSNWMLWANKKNHPFISKLKQKYITRFTTMEKYRYWEFHDTACELINEDIECKKVHSFVASLKASRNMRLPRFEQLKKKNTPFNDFFVYKRPPFWSLPFLVDNGWNYWQKIDPQEFYLYNKDIVANYLEMLSLGDTEIKFTEKNWSALENTSKKLEVVGNYKRKIRQKFLVVKRTGVGKIKKSTLNSAQYAFIHIGKCGGTSMKREIQTIIKPLKYYHLKRPLLTEDLNNQNFILFLRNPIARFVSAFLYAKSIIDYPVEQCQSISSLTLRNNCPAPQRIRRKYLGNQYFFNKKYDTALRMFNSINELINALNSANSEYREAAFHIINEQEDHVYKGIGWYTYNGELIQKSPSSIFFVGRIENSQSDIQRLKLSLQKEQNLNFCTNEDAKKITNLRKTSVSDECKYLSQESLEKIIGMLLTTDYRALKILQEYNFISKDILDQYYSYKYIY